MSEKLLLTTEKINKNLESNIEYRITHHLGFLALALKANKLGINDTLTHLHQYFHRGKESLIGIKEDFETDIAERLEKTPFVNYVNFKYTGNDFLSIKDKVSMYSMTTKNLEVLSAESINNKSLSAELARAEVEAQEVAKLTNWFINAPIGANLVFESLPIGDQKFAIPRIYKKKDNDHLEGCFVSLYNPSVKQFNNFRKALGVKTPICNNELEVLQNHYEFYNPKINKAGEFIDFYVDTYDKLLQQQDGQEHSFGLLADKTKEKQNGIEKVRQNPDFVSIYLDVVEKLAKSNGKITPDLIKINKKLGLHFKLKKGQEISLDLARDLLIEVRTYIASSIDMADTKLLKDIKGSDVNSDAIYDVISHFGNQAKAEGKTYASGGCPEINRTNKDSADEDDPNSELFILNKRYNNLPNNFGEARIDVCRTSNCPSHGKLGWLFGSLKTLVGGCGFCVCCHKHLEKGKDPKVIYKQQETNKIAEKNKEKTKKSLKKVS